MKFVVVVPSSSETSGGCNVLFYIAKKLSEYGHDSKVYVIDRTYTSTIYTNYVNELINDDDTFIICSEIIDGLSIDTKKIIRWILFGTYLYPQYHKHEIIYYFAPFCKNNPANKRLSFCYWPAGLENKNLVRTNESCYIAKKGMYNPIIYAMFTNNTVPLKGLNLEGLNHEQLIKTFNTTKYFYCYDPCCFLVVMALMCGCIVVQYPIIGYTAKEWKYAVNLPTLNGVSYGHDNLTHAEATIGFAAADCLKFKELNEISFKNFINDLETGNYTYEPCYPYNDSPNPFTFDSILMYYGTNNYDPKINILYTELIKLTTPQNFFGNLI
jgi:hypothetical protein